MYHFRAEEELFLMAEEEEAGLEEDLERLRLLALTSLSLRSEREEKLEESTFGWDTLAPPSF